MLQWEKNSYSWMQGPESMINLIHHTTTCTTAQQKLQIGYQNIDEEKNGYSIEIIPPFLPTTAW